MAEYASDLVLAGIAYDVDPRLVVAIAMTESTAGGTSRPTRTTPGAGAGRRAWCAGGSWTEAIHDLHRRFSSRYDTDSLDHRMARKYCPPCADHWLSTVRTVYEDI
jgi:hypothetical protein